MNNEQPVITNLNEDNSLYPKQPVSQNVIKLVDFETRINTLNIKVTETASILSENKLKYNEMKTNITDIKNEANDNIKQTNENIGEKIKLKFKQDFDLGEKMIMDNQTQSEQLQAEIEELYNKINGYEMQSNERIIIYRKKMKDLNDLKHQYEILKEGYDDAAKENLSYKQTIQQRQVKETDLQQEIEDMKQVIAKLTDARVILNKYFSSHYENFTEDEKRLIQMIEGNVLPGHYNNNPVLPDSKVVINKGKDNVNANPNPNANANVNPNKWKSSERYDKQEKAMNPIMNEEEYVEYQKKLKATSTNDNSRMINNGLPQTNQVILPQIRPTSMRNSGPDDDYWYENNKQKK